MRMIGWWMLLLLALGGCAPRYLLDNSPPQAPLVLPDDDAAHYGAQMEWWYYTGHLSTEKGQHFGFELTFFKRLTNEDRAPWWLGGVPAHWIKDVGMLAHFAVTDLGHRRFVASQRHNLFHPWRAEEQRYRVGIEKWTAEETGGSHRLRAAMDGYAIDLRLTPTKPAVRHGPNGIVDKGQGQANYYYSYTNMQVEGTLTAGTQRHSVKGKAWMDHEYGQMGLTGSQKGWDWFSIQLDDEREIMLYLIKDQGGLVDTSGGTYVLPDGRSMRLELGDLELTTVRTWQSPRTGAEYPAGWRLTLPQYELELAIEPRMASQEMTLKPVTYWEGAVDVSGTSAGAPVRGRGYVELVGYDEQASFDDLKLSREH